MATAKENLNVGCRVCAPSDSSSTLLLGSLLEAFRDALEEIQVASQLTDFAAFKAALDATATNLTAVTAASGLWDLDNN